MNLIVLTALVFSLLNGTPQQAPSARSAETAVREADVAWAKAIAAKSVEQTVAMYDPEAVTAGSAMFPAVGREAFRANWTKLFAEADFVLTWKADRVSVIESGTIAYTSGTWRMAAPDAGGPYLAVWRKQQDGEWKVLVDAAWYGGARQ